MSNPAERPASPRVFEPDEIQRMREEGCSDETYLEILDSYEALRARIATLEAELEAWKREVEAWKSLATRLDRIRDEALAPLSTEPP